ncbi:MAG: fibrobacter succinogenes major paralogous domain-containing protein, partial [Bacteroidales bacterium]
DTETKGTKGGFAVGGFDMAKGTKDEYLRITRDSTRVYLNNTATKGTKGGFAVGGFDMAKGTENNYMLVSPDSTMVYVRSLGPDSSSTFNIVATNLVQERKYLLQANTDTIGISGVLNVHNNVLVTGNINLSGSTVQDTSHVTDLDGNTYKTIRIGTQIWMAEDLKTTKFNDGTAILNVVDPGLWSSYSPAYCWYNNAATYKSTYGALYNWFAASAGNLCPIGWRVPFNDDWMTLSNYLGEGGGGMIKETGTSHWTSPNEGATNETGFTALPGGSRTVDGLFDGMGLYENWWTSTSGDGTGGYWSVSYDSNGIMSDFNNWYIGSAVRCIYGQY